MRESPAQAIRAYHHGTTTGYRRGCRCAECWEANRAQCASWSAAHPEAKRTLNLAYRAAHREAELARSAAYYATHREADLARSAAWRAAHREQTRERNASYYTSHSEDERASHAAWRAAHREQIRAHDASYHATHPEAALAAKHRRRARLAGVGSEPFTRAEIAERDGWRCRLCGEPVDPELRYPDPLSQSLDHVIPIARGGPNTRANSQLAHLRCNLRKQHREAIPAQIRLGA